MNVNMWSGKKKVIALVLIILAVVGIVLTLFLVQRQQELRSRAEKSTTLSLTPSSLQAGAGETVALDVVVNPGNNQVGFVTLDIKYDSNSFTVEDDAFELDSSTGFQVISSGQIVAPGEYKVTVSAGSDPTNVIQGAAKKLGTFRMGVNSDAPTGTYNVEIDQTNSIVTSIASNDDLGSVLNQTIGSKIIVGGGICKPNIATCDWDEAEGATSYHYVITANVPGGSEVQQLAEGDTSDTSVEFEAVIKEGESFNYVCRVTANNECGESGEAEGNSNCNVPSGTPTPTPTLTGTPTPTPTTSITNTPTPTTPREETPTPTTPEETVETPTPTKVTVVVTQPEVPGGAKGGVEEVVNTPTPTIAETGNPVVYGGIIGGILFVLGGIALLFL